MDISRPSAMAIKTNAIEPLHKTESPAKLREQAEQAAEQFETMMAAQLLKSMQSSLEGGNLFGGGTTGDIYSGIAEWELAQMMARDADFGLKEQILRQLPGQEEAGV